jgi:hypothetical protein
MTLRHIVYSLLAGSTDLVLLVGERIYDAGALGTPTGKDIPAKPFVVTTYGPDQGGPAEDARVEDRLVDIYFYGEMGDFTAVERGQRAIKAALHNATGVFVDPDTSQKTWLTLARFTGSGPDIVDDIYRANCRYGTYRLIGSNP